MGSLSLLHGRVHSNTSYHEPQAVQPKAGQLQAKPQLADNEPCLHLVYTFWTYPISSTWQFMQCSFHTLQTRCLLRQVCACTATAVSVE